MLGISCHQDLEFSRRYDPINFSILAQAHFFGEFAEPRRVLDLCRAPRGRFE